MPRSHLALLSLLWTACWLCACNLVFGVDDLEPTSASAPAASGASAGGNGGAAVTTSTAASGGNAGGGMGGGMGSGGMGGGVALNCGDGIIDMGEQCDDGNMLDGDMCSERCTVECEAPRVQRFGDNHCYLPEPMSMLSWQDARDFCTAVGPGWYLATVSDVPERDFVDGIMQSVRYWVGGSDLQLEGTFVWVNGEPWLDNLWDAGEPSGGGEDCVEMVSQSTTNNTDDVMNDQDCANLRGLVCEHTPIGM